MTTIYVICWKYSDGSGFGVVRAYEDEERAQKDLEMMRDICDARELFIEQTEVQD